MAQKSPSRLAQQGKAAGQELLTTRALIALLSRVDPEGNRKVLLQPAWGPGSFAVDAQVEPLWDDGDCVVVRGRS
jgi:hypothetical protein